MAEHNNLGELGEAEARRFLAQKGYEILENNWRQGHLEADIIAYHEGRLVFVEVKTRTSDLFGTPEEFVDAKKRKAYIKLANAYVLKNGRSEEVRFDIVSVLVGKRGVEIKHFVDAYTTVG